MEEDRRLSDVLVECLTQLKHDRALPQLKVLQYLVLFINTGEASLYF